MKIIVAHPGRQHSFYTASALKESGDLYKYITTVYNKPKSITWLLAKLAKGDLKKKIESRRFEGLADSDVIQFNEILVIITLFLNKLPYSNKIASEWNGFVESLFYKKVMRYAKKQAVDAIIVYNGYAKKYFEILKDTSIIKVIDVSIAGREFLRDILQKEINETGISQIKKDHFTYWNKKMIRNDLKGCQDADYFLVPSNFVRKSMLEQGASSDQLFMIPYGVDISKFKNYEEKRITRPLKLIYTGGVAYRKGLHRLFNVLQKFNKSDIELNIAGAYDPTSELYLQNKDRENIHFLGFVTRDKLNEVYNLADAFILPSFAEGMAMVGLEALACGLPVICTFNSGVNDVILDGINGFVYEASNEKKLEEILCWCCNNRKAVAAMSKNAIKTAENYTWEIYKSKLVNVMHCIIANRIKK